MCQSRVDKEEVIVAQTASGSNEAVLKDIGNHLERANWLTIVTVVFLTVIAGYIMFKMYRKCHRRWMQEQMVEHTLARFQSLRRRERAVEAGAANVNIP